MNKTELIKAISEKAGSTNKDAETHLNAFIDVAMEALKKGEDITLVGFESFSVVKRTTRTGMNFKTKEAINIPASKSVKFKVGKNLKDAVN